MGESKSNGAADVGDVGDDGKRKKKKKEEVRESSEMWPNPPVDRGETLNRLGPCLSLTTLDFFWFLCVQVVLSFFPFVLAS